MKINPVTLMHHIELRKLVQQEVIKQQQLQYIQNRKSDIEAQTKGANVDVKV